MSEEQHVLAPQQASDLLDQAIITYLSGLAPNTQRAYASRLFSFVNWREAQPPAPLVAHLKQYMSYLQLDRGLSPRSIQAHINTIKGMLRTAAALDTRLAPGLAQLELVKTPSVRGQIQGKRLNARQAHALLEAPGIDTVKGLRDSAILGLLLILGLRRSEVCGLAWGHIDEMEGHHVIVNLKGKHGRVRTLKLPGWLHDLIMAWGSRSGLNVNRLDHFVFVPITKDGRVLAQRSGMTPHAIYKLVNTYTRETGLPSVKPHDLRRTAALLARRGGASIEQVQLMLGHASPQTTSSYIGESLDLDDNAVDYNPLQI
jgi:integrase